MKTQFWKTTFFIKKLGLWSVYFIFACYILYLCVVNTNMSTKITFGLIGLVSLSIAILFEYLKYLYEKMIAALTIHCDLPLAKMLRTTLQQKDLFHGFKHSLIIFDSMLLLDSGDYQDCLKHLETHTTFFHSSLDYLLIYHYTQAHCYYLLDEKEEAATCLKELIKNKSNYQKRARGLFSWEEIEGFYYFTQNRNQKSLACFHQVNQSLLNHREQSYLLYKKAHCLLQSGNISEGNRLLKEVQCLGNTLAIANV